MEHEEHNEHEELADEFDRRADKLARENAELETEIDEVRKDWEAKRNDPGVPGAVPPQPDDARILRPRPNAPRVLGAA